MSTQYISNQLLLDMINAEHPAATTADHLCSFLKSLSIIDHDQYFCDDCDDWCIKCARYGENYERI